MSTSRVTKTTGLAAIAITTMLMSGSGCGKQSEPLPVALAPAAEVKAPVEKPAEDQAGKQAGQDDLPARIQKLEQTVQRLERESRSRPLPPANSTGIAGIAWPAFSFGAAGFLFGLMAFIRANALSGELQQLRADRDQSKSTETPGRTNGSS